MEMAVNLKEESRAKSASMRSQARSGTRGPRSPYYCLLTHFAQDFTAII
jgi:hypothetical protein